MSVLLQGLEMPKEGYLITINIYRDGCWCYANSNEHGKAIEVPKHGDLIDRDALNKEIDKAECYSYDPFVAHMSKCINDASTIIEEER